jgi:teichuronic acid biosynthesis glycosyltransferase TuaC
MRILVLTAMYPTPARPEFGSFVRTQVRSLESAGADVEVMVIDGANRKLMYPRAVPRLRARLAQRRADVVHAHYSYAGVVAMAQRSAPVVLTFHGDDLLGTRDARGRTEPWSRAVAAGGQMLGERVDGVIVQTEQMARRLRRPDVHVLPHEVDLETFRPTPREEARRELGLRKDGRYVLFAASPTIPVKNFSMARDAVSELRQDDPRVELVVCVHEPQPRLALYMSACDVLAFPSWQEGSPNVVKQAMACNLPIVATDVGDVRAVIGGTTGCHVVGFDTAQFASRLGDELLRRRRTEGRGAVRHLSGERVARRLLEVYDGVARGTEPCVG